MSSATAAPGQLTLSDVAAGNGGFVMRLPAEDGVFLSLAGHSVAGAGDVNGDGLADVIVGAPLAPCANGSTDNCGRTYVVFGRPGGTPIDLRQVENGVGGFVIYGSSRNQYSGTSVSGGCDINGDGLDDLVLGAPRDEDTVYDVRRFNGAGFVVFGKADGAPVTASASALGNAGFVIQGVSKRDKVGAGAACAGDVNGDGLADVVVSAEGDNRAYLVFGKADVAAVPLRDVATGTGGFVIEGFTFGASSAAGAGDVNGDGLADLILGAPYETVGAFRSGRGYIVFGKADTAPVNAAALAAGTGRGFVVNGDADTDLLGRSVHSAGDVNGDGLADLILGAPNGSASASVNAGRALVVFGKPDAAPVQATAIAAGAGGGFAIRGTLASSEMGTGVAGVGDLNGDGLSDLMVGAPATADYAGEAYVVWGKTGAAPVDVPGLRLGAGGFTLVGEPRTPSRLTYTGSGVAAAGDVNGDGLADLIVGASFADSAYVVHGSTTGVFTPTFYAPPGDDAADLLTGTPAAEGLAGGAGADTLSGEGGADALVGGPGDDTHVLTRANLAALQAVPTAGTARAARVDGGAGDDTIAFQGPDLANIDLRRIPLVGAGLPGSTSRLESIERIDLSGNGPNALSLNIPLVQDMAGMNRIRSDTQAALGWVNGSYRFQAKEERHQLVITGDEGDTLRLSGRWAVAGAVSRAGVVYTVVNSRTGRAQLLVAQNLRPGVR